MQKQNILQQGVLLVSIVLGGSLFGQAALGAVGDQRFSLDCFPQSTSVRAGGVFTQEGGAPLNMMCEVLSDVANETMTVRVLGTQKRDDVAVASSSADVAINGGESADAILVFPAVFQGGQYQYVFALTDLKTGEVMSINSVKTGEVTALPLVVKLAASVDKERYDWGEGFTLTTTLDTKEQDIATLGMVLSVAMRDTSDNECTVLLDSQPITEIQTTTTLVFPPEGACVNTVVVAIKNKEGAVLDQQTLAVGLPEKKASDIDTNNELVSESFGSIPGLFKAGLAMTMMLILSLIGYFLIRKQQTRKF